MTRKKKILSILILCGWVSFGFADQYAYLSREDAERARDLLTHGATILEYCRPCGDVNFKKTVITDLEVRHTGYETYYEILVNGTPIDLAYIYIYHEDHWTNLAWALSLEASDVPFYLKLPKNPKEDLVLASQEIFEKTHPKKKPE